MIRNILFTIFKYNNLNLFTILNLKNRFRKIIGASVPRQPFIIKSQQSTVGSRQSKEQLYKKLISIGYQWNYFSYYDKDELINVRRLYDDRQIHVRIFKDGAIHIHDELNYEFYPYDHLRAKTFKQADKNEIEKILTAING